MPKGIGGQNPLVVAYGPGPEGKTCATCTHFRYPEGYARKHWKCDLRVLNHSSSTDHSPRWPACPKYNERTEPYHGG